jgi:hypothetical protein
LSVFCPFGKGNDTRQRERRTEHTHTHTHTHTAHHTRTHTRTWRAPEAEKRLSSLDNESSVTSERALVRRFIHSMFIHIIQRHLLRGSWVNRMYWIFKEIYDLEQDRGIPRRLQPRTGYHTEYIDMEEKKGPFMKRRRSRPIFLFLFFFFCLIQIISQRC